MSAKFLRAALVTTLALAGLPLAAPFAATRNPCAMMLIKQFPDISLDDTLFVFALEAEAGDVFTEVNTVFTGIGKVNAAIALTKAVATRRPRLIVNLGSAGSQRHGKGEVVFRFIGPMVGTDYENRFRPELEKALAAE